MQDVLLVSETTIKSRTNIDDNVNGKLILPAIRSAQEEGLRCILGDKLLDKVKNLVQSGEIELENYSWYKNLVIYAQDYLVYQAVSDVCMLTVVKISNAGLEQVSDEKMEPISISDSYSVQKWYQEKADFYCYRLQNWLIKNRVHFKEITGTQWRDIRSNLYSAASSGLWLGGARGKGPYWKTLQEKYDNPFNFR